MPSELSSYFLDGTIAWVDPSLLKVARDNPRKSLRLADPERFNGLKESLKRGFFTPLLVEGSTQELIAGHQRRDAAIELKMKKVPVIFLRDLTREERIRIRATDNAAGGFWDTHMLAEQLLELPKDEIPMLGLDALTLDLVEPLAPTEEKPEEDLSAFHTLKFKVPAEAAIIINQQIKSLCDRDHVKPGTALERIVVEWAQSPGNSAFDHA